MIRCSAHGSSRVWIQRFHWRCGRQRQGRRGRRMNCSGGDMRAMVSGGSRRADAGRRDRRHEPCAFNQQCTEYIRRGGRGGKERIVIVEIAIAGGRLRHEGKVQARSGAANLCEMEIHEHTRYGTHIQQYTCKKTDLILNTRSDCVSVSIGIFAINSQEYEPIAECIRSSTAAPASIDTSTHCRCHYRHRPRRHQLRPPWHLHHGQYHLPTTTK